MKPSVDEDVIEEYWLKILRRSRCAKRPLATTGPERPDADVGKCRISGRLPLKPIVGAVQRASMGRKRNAQVQVRDRGATIMETARSFVTQPERFRWLQALLASRSLDPDAGILVELRSVPDQGCWVHYGTWLTASGTFLKFVADEAFGQRPLDGSGLLQYSNVEETGGREDEPKRASRDW